ncbi:MAG: hypothetical protein K2N80_04455 [Lachnospiraceae bacterium]|nr:hypothetical protein [Lachnospiraceae bacterium]
MIKYIQQIKSAIESNRVTLVIILSYTIWEAARAAIPYEYYWDIHFLVDMISRALPYLIIFSLFIETYFAESKMKCICGYVIAVIFSGAAAACGDLYVFSPAAVNEDLPGQIYRILPVNIQQIAGPRGTYMKHYAELFLCGILLVLSVAIVYKSFKKAKLRFWEYLIRVFHIVIKSLAIWFVLDLCSAFIDSIMANYFFYEYYFEYNIQIQGRILVMNFFWMGPIEVLAMGGYLGPKMLLALKGADRP